MGSFSGHFGDTSGSFRGRSGVILGSFWGHFGFTLGSLWGRLGSFEGHFAGKKGQGRLPRDAISADPLGSTGVCMFCGLKTSLHGGPDPSVCLLPPMSRLSHAPLMPQSLARQPQSLARQPQSLALQPQSLARQPQSLAQQEQWQQHQLQRARGGAARAPYLMLSPQLLLGQTLRLLAQSLRPPGQNFEATRRL